MYRHERVEEIMDRAQRVVRDLFEAYMDDPEAAAAELARGCTSADDRSRLPARSATSSPA